MLHVLFINKIQHMAQIWKQQCLFSFVYKLQ